MYRQHTDSETFRDPKFTFEITQKVRRLAVRKYGYHPSLKSKIVALAQKIILNVVPSSFIFPLYTFIRRTKITETFGHLSLKLSSN